MEDLTVFQTPVLKLAVENLTKLDENGLSTLWEAFRKVSSLLENGRRLENLSERLYYRQANAGDICCPASTPPSQASSRQSSIYDSEPLSLQASSKTMAPIHGPSRAKRKRSIEQTEPPPSRTVTKNAHKSQPSVSVQKMPRGMSPSRQLDIIKTILPMDLTSPSPNPTPASPVQRVLGFPFERASVSPGTKVGIQAISVRA